ncbi:Fibronectin domain-containing protein, partial [Oryctes borbonicus]
MSRCVTYEECTSLPDKDMFIIGDKNCTHTCPKRYQMKYENKRKYCEFCGDNCTKECEGVEVENMNILKSLEGCTTIKGSLTITLGKTATITQKELAYNLEEIRIITGELKIQRTYQIESLDFLKKLKEVRGLKTHSLHKYVVTVRDNVDLIKLFDWSTVQLNLGPGNISFHYNPMLCLSEIEEFAKRTNKTASFEPENIHISKLSNGDQAACSKRYDLNIEEFNKNATFMTLRWSDPEEYRNELIGYYVHYKATKNCNETNDTSRDNCESQDWMTHLVTEPCVNLTDLTPFTSYFYYIKILTNKSNSETPVRCFKSSAHDPSPPSDVILAPVTSDTITLKWKAPELPNGILSHYVLFGFMQKDDRTLLDKRNYCNKGITFDSEPKKLQSYLESDESNGTCSCDDFIHLNTKTLEKLCYYHVNLGMDLMNSCNDYKVEIINLPPDSPIQINKRGEGWNLDDLTYREVYEKIDADVTIYNLTNLYHYTQYVFYFSACNTEENISHCSAVMMEYARTLRKEDADDIQGMEIEIDKNNTYISWKEPE